MSLPLHPDSAEAGSDAGVAPATPTAASQGTGPSAPRGVFARRVASVLATRVTLFVIAFATSILLSRLLGPDGKGTYVAIVTLPGMLAALGMFGLPAAVNYFAGRGSSVRSLARSAYLFTAVLSVVLLGIAWFSLPALELSILKAARDNDTLLRVIILVVPLGILSAFGGAILYGRQAVRAYNLIQIALALVTLVSVAVLVGALRLGVTGAVAGTLLVSAMTAIAVMAAVYRLGRAHPDGPPAALRGLMSYGARSYPASMAGFFNYRADTYVLQAVVLNANTAANMLGLYSMAVTMAELVFYVPDSITTIFLPHVAGSAPEDAHRMVARVGRLTTLLTVALAVCLVPVAWVGIHLVLPKFVDCLPAFIVLLPGVMSLSVAKVMTSYVAGRGRPGLVTFGTCVALVLNVGLNIFLIPMYGIVGASLSSLISYTVQAGIAVVIASRLSGQSPLSLFVPGPAEVHALVATLGRLLGGIGFVHRLRSGPRKVL